MPDVNAPHPSPETLAAFDLGQLPPGEWPQVEAHVAQCERCCRLLESLADDALVALLKTSAGRKAGVKTCDHRSSATETPSSGRGPARSEPRAELAGHPRYPPTEPLGDALTPSPASPILSPASDAKRNPWAWAIAVVFLLSMLPLGVVLAWFLMPTAPPPPPGESALEVIVPAGPPSLLTNKELGEAGVAWVKARNRWGPEHKLVNSTRAKIDEAVATKGGFIYRLGCEMVDSRKTTLLASRGGSFFVFELTPEQSQAGKFASLSTLFLTIPADNDLAGKTPQVSLSDLHIDNAEALAGGQEIRGGVAYRKWATVDHPCSAHVAYVGDGNWRNYFHPTPTPAAQEGFLTFQVLKPAGLVRNGPQIIFVNLCQTTDANKREAISNTLALIVNVVGNDP